MQSCGPHTGNGLIMIERIEKKRLAILRVLKNSTIPLASRTIKNQLVQRGYDISERTVRFHLLDMDCKGLTEYINKKGRRITPLGISELSKARVFEKVGFLNAKIDQMTYGMNLNLDQMNGTVVVNTSLIRREDMPGAAPLIKRVFDAGYSMGRLMTLFWPGEQIGDIYVPEGYIGIGTVCSITLNGVLLSKGIPIHSRFGGILEIENRKATRFVAIINYDGTSLDPLEIFTKSGMTDHIGATMNGNGLIGASFREVPAASRERVIEIAKRLDEVGLGGVYEVGLQGHNLCEIPLNEGLIGIIVIGGLNPVAILAESGYDVSLNALTGHVDYHRLFSYEELDALITKLL